MKYKALILALGTVLVWASPASATEIVNFTAAGVTQTADPNQTIGFSFTLNAPITIYGLSFWDGSGLTGSHDVGLWATNTNTNTVTLLASATVTSADPLDGSFRVATIAPLLLTPNPFVYTVGAIAGTENFTYNPSGFSTISKINFVGDRSSPPGSGPGLTFPTDSFGLHGLFGANARLAVPDGGSTAILMSLGCVALGVLRRKIAS